jgi:hypothetical protein
MTFLSKKKLENFYPFIFFSLLSHFIIYGLPFFGCVLNNFCFYYHNNFFFFYPTKLNFYQIYLKTLFFFILCSLIFFYSTETKILDRKLSKIFINKFDKTLFIKILNIVFFSYTFIFLIINFIDFSSFFVIRRYQYNPQSLTVLWLLGFATAKFNLILENRLTSFIIIILISLMLILDGSRLWVLIIAAYCLFYLYLKKLNFYKKFFFFAIIILLLSFTYVFFIDNVQRNFRANLPKIESNYNSLQEEQEEQEEINCDLSKILVLSENLKESFESNNVNYIENCKKNLNGKEKIFSYINFRLKLDGIFHVYIAYLYPSKKEYVFFESILFNLGFIKNEEFEKENALSDRIIKANHLNNNLQGGINLNAYASFIEQFTGIIERFFFFIIFGLIIYFLNFLLKHIVNKDKISSKFMAINLFFFLSFGSTNNLRSSLKLIIFEIILLIGLFFMSHLLKKFKLKF